MRLSDAIAKALAGDPNLIGNENALLAMVGDFAPDLVKERRLMRALVQCGGFRQLAAVRGATAQRQAQAKASACQLLTSSLGVDAASASQICDEVLRGLSVPVSRPQPVPAPAPVPKPVQQPTPWQAQPVQQPEKPWSAPPQQASPWTAQPQQSAMPGSQQPQQVTVNIWNAQQTAAPAPQPAPAVPAPQFGMKWHKWLIYFLLWAWALYRIGVGILDVTGSYWESFENVSSEVVYALYPSLQGADILYGLCCIVVGCLMIRTRFDLAKFRARGPRWLVGLRIADLVYNCCMWHLFLAC